MVNPGGVKVALQYARVVVVEEEEEAAAAAGEDVTAGTATGDRVRVGDDPGTVQTNSVSFILISISSSGLYLVILDISCGILSRVFIFLLGMSVVGCCYCIFTIRSIKCGYMNCIRTI